MHRNPQILDKRHSVLLIIDVQKKINAVMQAGDRVVASAVKLIKACQTLEIPIFITEQYPQGLGPTEGAILEALGGAVPVQKMTFSCCGSEELLAQMNQQGVKQVIVVGIECHVCVQQTALDLLTRGFQVHVPKDGVSSRKVLDYDTALERMARAGVILTSVESVLFELLEQAGTPEFKTVTRLIK
ncbi:MAG: hydrolase [bacterium]